MGANYVHSSIKYIKTNEPLFEKVILSQHCICAYVKTAGHKI